MRGTSVILLSAISAAAPAYLSDSTSAENLDDMPLAPIEVATRSPDGLQMDFPRTTMELNERGGIDVEHFARGDGLMSVGKEYEISDWVFTVGQFIIEQLGGTKMQFPTKDTDIAKIAIEVGKDIVRRAGAGRVTSSFSDGWSYTCEMFGDGYTFNMIPSAVLLITIQDAIHAASGWPTADNVFNYILNDTNGRALFQLIIQPAVNNGRIVRYHDEFKRLSTDY